MRTNKLNMLVEQTKLNTTIIWDYKAGFWKLLWRSTIWEVFFVYLLMAVGVLATIILYDIPVSFRSAAPPIMILWIFLSVHSRRELMKLPALRHGSCRLSYAQIKSDVKMVKGKGGFIDLDIHGINHTLWVGGYMKRMILSEQLKTIRSRNEDAILVEFMPAINTLLRSEIPSGLG